MRRVRFWHVPSYMSFVVQSDKASDPSDYEKIGQDLVSIGVSVDGGVARVGVKDDTARVPIDFEVHEVDPGIDELIDWSGIVEFGLKVGDRLVLSSATGEEVGSLGMDKGPYRLRVYFGSHSPDSVEPEEFFLIQIWPGTDKTIKKIK